MAERYPDVPAYRVDLGRAYARLALILHEDPAEARPLAQRAVREHVTALESSPDSPNYRKDLWGDEVILSEILLRLGAIDAAALAAEELPRLVPDNLKSYQYAVDRLTRCARASEDHRSDYEARAVRALEEAVKRRVIRDARQLEEFRALKHLDDFRKLGASLSSPRAG
jgi:hypothetical protein